MSLYSNIDNNTVQMKKNNLDFNIKNIVTNKIDFNKYSFILKY